MELKPNHPQKLVLAMSRCVQVGAAEQCWPWSGRMNERGYGRPQIAGKDYRAHRVAWELFNKRCVPEGMFVLHSCDNPSCCNPAHLRVGTMKDNMSDALARSRVPVGSRNVRAKLTEAAVLQIRASTEQTATLARRFGVDRKTIWQARNGRWRHVGDR